MKLLKIIGVVNLLDCAANHEEYVTGLGCENLDGPARSEGHQRISYLTIECSHGIAVKVARCFALVYFIFVLAVSGYPHPANIIIRNPKFPSSSSLKALSLTSSIIKHH